MKLTALQYTELMSATWAQGMFFFCGVVIAPVGGFFAARQAKGKFRLAFSRFVGGTLMVWGALAAGGGLAGTLHPDYPATPVSEWGAIAFTLPAFAAALFAWRLFPAVAGIVPSNRVSLHRSLALFFLYVCGIAITYQAFTWPFRRALPWTAHGVRDSAWTDGFLPDYAYFLRARVTREQFLAYVQKYDLREVVPPTPMGRSEQASWWKPPADPPHTYSRRENDWAMTADYANGVMHVRAIEQ